MELIQKIHINNVKYNTSNSRKNSYKRKNYTNDDKGKVTKLINQLNYTRLNEDYRLKTRPIDVQQFPAVN